MSSDNLTGSIDEPVEDGDTALHLACLYGHLPCVRVSCSYFCVTLFFLIFFLIYVSVIINNCRKNLFSFPIQLLLERGANLEAEDEDGGIPLHDACAGG